MAAETNHKKVIFITLFQGVAAKNILRTPILTTLLSDGRIHIVLLARSSERSAYYAKEFANDQITYEVVKMAKPSSFDWIFSKLKYVLLCTETTDLQRKMRQETQGSSIWFMFDMMANRVFARPFFRKIVRVLDYILVQDATYGNFFEKYHPSLVFMTHLFDDQEIHLLREAKKRGVRTVSLINSWDKVTARCILRLLPDKLITYNEIVKKELIQHNEVLRTDIFVGGIAQYDSYFKEKRSSRDDFFKRIGLNPMKKLILYGSMGKAYSASDWDMIDLLYRLKNEGAFGDGIEILVRFQPNDFINEAELKKRPHMRYDYPGTRFGEVRGTDWDMSSAELAHLGDTLAHMSLLVCYASSLSVDAAIFDKPVININFEVVKSATMQESPTQYYKTAHYKKALDSGGIKLVGSEQELVSTVREYLGHPSNNEDGRRKLVASQCVFTDGLSGKRIGDFLLAYIR